MYVYSSPCALKIGHGISFNCASAPPGTKRLPFIVTLHWCNGGLREANVVSCNVVRRLVLRDLYTGAHVALAVEEEGEGARQALAGDRKQRRFRALRGEECQQKHAVVRPLFVSALITSYYVVSFNHTAPLT